MTSRLFFFYFVFFIEVNKVHDSHCCFSTLVRFSEGCLECLFRLFHHHRHTVNNGLCDRLKKI